MVPLKIKPLIPKENLKASFEDTKIFSTHTSPSVINKV